MSFERFIARRFMPRSKDGGGFSGPLSAIAVASIALGVVVMVMAVSILHGFQGEITGKVVGFGSHMTVTSFTANGNYQENPISKDSALTASILRVPGVHHLQYYATKGGMVKTGEQIYGILFRGVSANYDTTFFAQSLLEGRLPKLTEPSGDSSVADKPSNDVLISSTIASRLKLKTGDKMRTYFWQGESYRSRAFTVCGIYNTDLTEFDENYVLGDLRQVQRLNEWDGAEVGGFEILVDDFDRLNAVAREVTSLLPYHLTLHTITETHPALFSWLDLLNSNITLILTIMCLVSAIAIISALLIMIFEKRTTIGLLKALGATNRSVRRIFMMKASHLILRGILIGDAIALALCLIQSKWQVLTLDPESYSMSHVPVDLDPWMFAAITAGTLGICIAALLLPAASIAKISPAKTIKSE